MSSDKKNRFVRLGRGDVPQLANRINHLRLDYFRINTVCHSQPYRTGEGKM